MDDVTQYLEQAKLLVETIIGRLPSDGRERLLMQARTMSNLAGSIAFLSFEVDRNGTKPEFGVPNLIPCRPEVLSPDGTSFGELMVWRDDAGYIDSLEYTWWEGNPPDRLPGVDHLRFS